MEKSTIKERERKEKMRLERKERIRKDRAANQPPVRAVTVPTESNETGPPAQQPPMRAVEVAANRARTVGGPVEDSSVDDSSVDEMKEYCLEALPKLVKSGEDLVLVVMKEGCDFKQLVMV